MTVRDWVDIAIFVLGGLLAIIGWLMRNEVQEVKKDIEMLYKLHHQDETQLTTLQVKLAENYPLKNDLRIMVQDIKDYFDDRFKLVEHLVRNNNKE